MNTQMAYLIGMVLGNGSVQRGNQSTTVAIDIPHKNMLDDEGRETAVYVMASVTDIRGVIEPLLGHSLIVTQKSSSTVISFTKPNQDYTMREIMRYIGNGAYHSVMKMNEELFSIEVSERKALLRGFADVTGYIRDSNKAFGINGHHRVYIEIPGNWEMVIDIANLLKSLNIPVQNIDFAHPNFRDGNMKMFLKGNVNSWKKEHQIKIWANEFLPVGFNIVHKQKALEKYANELMTHMDSQKTHKFYWEKPVRRKTKPVHPMENDTSLPASIRGKHYESWTDLAWELGYRG